MLNYDDNKYSNDDGINRPFGKKIIIDNNPVNAIPKEIIEQEKEQSRKRSAEILADYLIDSPVDSPVIVPLSKKTVIHTEPDIPFWAENPNILLKSEYIFEFFPVDTMTYPQKMNAVTRTIILLTIIGFIITKSIRLLIVSTITVISIYLVYYEQQKEKIKIEKHNRAKNAENFTSPAIDVLNDNGIAISPDTFDTPSDSNPLSNVLITDYDYNPNKKPAPPSYNQNVNDEILNQAKTIVRELNPDQPNISDKLFMDLGEQMTFEQSLQPFYSTANTAIPNDQAGFSEFCYGSMVSCKEGNMFACARNLSRFQN
jgi:hypothetical protein